VRVLHEFADGWHHRKEHQVVFPAVRKGAKDARPALQELARHDEECHALAERLRKLADAAAAGEVREQVQWKLAAMEACRAWEQHIRGENRLLVPLMARLGKRQQAEMAALDAKVPEHQRHGHDIERLLQSYARFAVAA
jgi:hemerythrin-like domain-containing protein